MSDTSAGICSAMATREAGCGRGFSPQTRVFCVWSKPQPMISWLDRDGTDESDSGWSAGGIPCRSRRGIMTKLRLVRLGLCHDGCAVELVDLVDQRRGVEVR